MALSTPTRRTKPEPTIALINIVFLMLIFFMIAGALTPPLDDEVKLVSTENLEGRPPPDATVLTADGELMYRSNPVTPEEVIALLDTLPSDDAGDDAADVRLVVDRDVPATVLMEQTAALRAAGATAVWIVTERGL